ncbi:hypothetical protein K1T71_001214 [Dendrolimus kikuchii]|uniref:Uncharacterized protein n=1 Tax=Dendrolimus kikuchii TaxID=765133 RepID=A0ACC1DHW6_9NEOP|nr:hypothetical protein K1T71_001214 [Dendrolimus kikuchii]
MSKGTPSKAPAVDLSKFCKSSFTVTFTVEVLGIDVWHDCNDGWLDLGPCIQGVKLQYQLYPGNNYDVDIMIWPHVAKIWCGTQYGWVRTFLLLERRWLTFSICHMFPVRVAELVKHIATVTPTVGLGVLSTTARNDKNTEVYLPPLKFMQRRYFAPIIQGEISLGAFIYELIWKAVSEYIPKSYLDRLFDVPYPVKDVRHQDAVLYHLKESILNRNIPTEPDSPKQEIEEPKPRDRRESRMPKEKEKKKVAEAPKMKYEIKLSGDAILAGTGRIIPFEASGDLSSDIGEILVLISSDNLPAQDDQLVVFVNIDKLCQIPVAEFKKVRIAQLYTRWILGDDVHNSLPRNVRSHRDFMYFNDHHALPLPPDKVSAIVSTFSDNTYEVQLRGICQLTNPSNQPRLFGYEKGDRDFGKTSPAEFVKSNVDFLIATTKIDARALSKGNNGFIRGEYPLYPPRVSVVDLNREPNCTNDINGVRAILKPDLIVESYLILQAQMTLEVSIGLVGCKPRPYPCFSRMYGLVSDTITTKELLRCVMKINEDISESGNKDDLLTGFALDTGDIVILFVEGPRDGKILQMWDMTENYYPKIKPVFSSSARFSTRIYPELLLAAMPFNILKMYVPLGALLACPPVYARPALPLPTRSAVLKLGRLIASKLLVTPCRSDMPTGAELKSFRLELCVAPRPMPVPLPEIPLAKLTNSKRGLFHQTYESTGGK